MKFNYNFKITTNYLGEHTNKYVNYQYTYDKFSNYEEFLEHVFNTLQTKANIDENQYCDLTIYNYTTKRWDDLCHLHLLNKQYINNNTTHVTIDSNKEISNKKYSEIVNKSKNISLHTQNTGIGSTELWNGKHIRFNQDIKQLYSDNYFIKYNLLEHIDYISCKYGHSSKWRGEHTWFY